MSELGRITRTIRMIWREHHRQQSLYLLAMGMEISTHLRKICCKGHITSVMFKKEIAFMYDHAKCCLTDGDLSTIMRADDMEQFAESEDFSGLFKQVMKRQQRSIDYYRAFAAEHSVYDDIIVLVNDHIEKLQELNSLLELAMPHDAQDENAFTAVA